MNDPKNSNDRRQSDHSEGMNIGDIYFVVFRQKWIILACSVAGLAAAIGMIVARPAQYQSEAKLLVRQVLERQVPTATDPGSVMKTTDGNSASIINTEIEILTSLDLAEQVASQIGPERILGRDDVPDATNAAALAITNGLNVDPNVRDSVIPIMYQHPDPEVARDVLQAIISAYLNKHTEMHRPVGYSDDSLTREAARLQAELSTTETNLVNAKERVNITSLEEAEKESADYISTIRQQLLTAEADIAELRAMSVATGAALPSTPTTGDGAAAVPSDIRRAYIANGRRLAQLNQKLQDLLVISPDTSPFVLSNQAEIADAEKEKQKLEELYPALASLPVATAVTPTQPGAGTDTAGVPIRLSALEARTNSLHMQLDKALADAAKLASAEAPIRDLERQQEAQEAQLKYFENGMQQNKIDEELGIGKGSGDISIVQSPSPPRRKHPRTFKKMVLGLAGGGVAAGLALAFFIELVLDRSVKRPAEVERKLHMPLFISIPDVNANGAARNASSNGNGTRLLKNGEGEVGLPAERAITVELPEVAATSGLERFYEGLRDRLMINFDIRNLTHHPKLVAVTSCGRGAGVTSIAAGLAASLSETGDGNVLLVDMNSGQGAARQFHKGQPACGLEDALENDTMESAHVKDRLYVAAERVGNERLPRVLPRRFANLMPKLKASDYDYIIFDMPPVSQTSVTSRLAGLMDTVLLVIEAEKTSQDVAKLAKNMLAESKASVGAVLNKTHSYVPRALHQESLEDV
jgi:succinoglycan biosynthesis transport protein ExoP